MVASPSTGGFRRVSSESRHLFKRDVPLFLATCYFFRFSLEDKNTHINVVKQFIHFLVETLLLSFTLEY